MAATGERIRRWTRAEYDHLISLGVFRSGEHLELLDGHLIVGEPQGSLHATAVGLVDDALRACFGDGWVVRCQMPIALDDESEPEPDVAVAPGARRDYATDHPSRPVLVVEVAESSLSDDRAIKAARNPFATSPPLEAWRYDDVTILGETASIAPLARPEVPVDVATLLPVASSYLG